MKAMVFAAGLGTRLLGETTDKPKALVELNGKTLIQRTIEKLKDEGISELVVNVHHFSDLIKNFISNNDFGIPIHISDESEKLLDTGGGLKKAARFFTDSDPILLYNVDIISNLNIKLLNDEHLNSGALATLVVRNRATQRYLKFNKQKQLVGWINKKTNETKISIPEDFNISAERAFSGIHIIQPELFKMMPEADYFSIVNLYLELAKSHLIKGYFDTSSLWTDVGKPNQLSAARNLTRDE